MSQEPEELIHDAAVPMFPSMADTYGEGETTEEKEEAETQSEVREDDAAFFKDAIKSGGNREADDKPRRRRGRPPGSRNKNPRMEAEEPRGSVSVPRNARQLEKEIAERGEYILLGATGLLGNIRPPVAMHPDEAKAIAEPLAAYLRKRAEQNEQVREFVEDFVERWDLIALTIAVMAYLVRVWRDDIEFRKFIATQQSGNLSGAQVSRRRRDESPDVVSNGEVQNVNGPENPNVPTGENASDGGGNYGPLRVPNVPGL